jgi:hypothetical protein
MPRGRRIERVWAPNNIMNFPDQWGIATSKCLVKQVTKVHPNTPQGKYSEPTQEGLLHSDRLYTAWILLARERKVYSPSIIPMVGRQSSEASALLG